MRIFRVLAHCRIAAYLRSKKIRVFCPFFNLDFQNRFPWLLMILLNIIQKHCGNHERVIKQTISDFSILPHVFRILSYDLPSIFVRCSVQIFMATVSDSSLHVSAYRLIAVAYCRTVAYRIHSRFEFSITPPFFR